MADAAEIVQTLRAALMEREYDVKGGIRTWRYRYGPEDLAPMVEDYARQFHVGRLTDAGFELVPAKPQRGRPAGAQ